MKNIFRKKLLIILLLAFVSAFALNADDAFAKSSKKVTWSKKGCGNFNIGKKHYGGSDACRVLGRNCPPPRRPTVNNGGGGSKPAEPALRISCAPEKSIYEVGEAVKWIGTVIQGTPSRVFWTGDFTADTAIFSKIYRAADTYTATFNGIKGRDPQVASSCSVRVCDYVKEDATGNRECMPCREGYEMCQGQCVGDGFQCIQGKPVDMRDVEITSFTTSPVIIPKQGNCNLEWTYIGNPNICTLVGTDGTSRVFQGEALTSPGNHTSESLEITTDFTLNCKNTETLKEDTAKASCIVNPVLIEN